MIEKKAEELLTTVTTQPFRKLIKDIVRIKDIVSNPAFPSERDCEVLFELVNGTVDELKSVSNCLEGDTLTRQKARVQEVTYKEIFDIYKTVKAGRATTVSSKTESLETLSKALAYVETLAKVARHLNIVKDLDVAFSTKRHVKAVERQANVQLKTKTAAVESRATMSTSGDAGSTDTATATGAGPTAPLTTAGTGQPLTGGTGGSGGAYDLFSRGQSASRAADTMFGNNLWTGSTGNLASKPFDPRSMLKKPDLFDGKKGKARAWMQAYKFCAKVNQWDEELMARLFPVYLEKTASNWYDVDIDGRGLTFKQIESEFAKQYYGMTEKAEVTSMIENARQGPGQSAQEFIVHLRKLYRQLDSITGEKTNDAVILDKVKNRLNDDYQYEVTMHKPRTLDELHQLCMTYEEATARRRGKVPVAVIQQYQPKGQGQQRAGQSARRTSQPARDQNASGGQERVGQASSARKDDPERLARIKKRTKCFQCGEFGHWRSECSARPRERNTSAPARNAGNNRAQVNRPSGQTINAVVETRDVAPVEARKKTNAINAIFASILDDSLIFRKIDIDGIDIRALIDTGAACSVIDRAVLGDERCEEIVTEEETPLLRAANGTSIPIDGKIYLDVELQIDSTIKRANCGIWVARCLQTPMIMGSDLCALFKLGIFCPDKVIFSDVAKKLVGAISLALDGKRNAAIQGPDQSLVPAIVTKHDKGGVYPVRTTYIPAGSVAMIPVSLSDYSGDDDVLITPWNVNHEYRIAASLHVPRDNQTMVRILNGCTKKIMLTKTDRIATWERLSREKEMGML